jgi:hypothetical protein
MSTTKNQRLPRIVKTVLDFIFGLLVIACALIALFIAFSPLIRMGIDIPFTSSVPVAIGSGGEPQFEVVIAGAEAHGIRAAFVNEAQGTLRLETTNWYFIFISNFAKLLTSIGLAYVVYLLRAVMQNLLQGEVFTQDNVARIRRIGYAVLIVAFVRAAAEYLAAYEILKQLTITRPALSLPSPFEAEVILASLLILVLAQVWSYGLDLEREKALTI